MWVIKQKNNDRFVCGTKSQKADHDRNQLVSLKYARIFPTISGAKSALASWCGVWDGKTYTVIQDIKKKNSLEIVLFQDVYSQVEKNAPGNTL